MQDNYSSAKEFAYLAHMLKHVYGPLENKRKDLQANMDQLSKIIQENIHKISQGAPINIPELPLGLSDTEIVTSVELCQKYEAAVVSSYSLTM
jgi:hypothetical protein